MEDSELDIIGIKTQVPLIGGKSETKPRKYSTYQSESRKVVKKTVPQSQRNKENESH